MIEWRTIVRKIEGTADQADDRAFEEWIAGSASHRIYYMKARARFRRMTPEPMEAGELDGLVARFDADVRRRMRGRSRRLVMYRAAAILLVPLVVSSLVFYFQGGVAGRSQAAERLAGISVDPGSSKASIVMADGTVFELDGMGDMVYRSAAAGTVLTKKAGMISFSGDDRTKVRQEKEHVSTIRIPRGGEYSLELSDGTKVWLNSKTTLKFPERFVGDTRTVELDGEAYFEVSRDAGRPFIVKTPGSQVRVLGTKFNVSAYSDEAVQHTTLCEGAVSVAVSGQELLLAPGQQAYMGRDGQAVVRQVDAALFASWHQGLLQFEDETLENIVGKLSKWYDADIVFASEPLKNLHFTGDLKRYDNLETILGLIRETCNIGFEVRERTLYITCR